MNALNTPNSHEHSPNCSHHNPTLRCAYPNCGKTFRFRSELDRHEAIHLNKRPFICPFDGCTKAFKREDALKTHIRIHTNDKIFQC